MNLLKKNNKKFTKFLVAFLLAGALFFLIKERILLAQVFKGSDATFDIFVGANPNISQSQWFDPITADLGDRVQGNATAWNNQEGTVAQYTKMRVEIPSETSTSHTLRVHIWADNAAEVTDTLVINTSALSRVSYVTGHATVFSPSCPNGCPLLDGALIGSGVTVGGVISGAGNTTNVTFKVDILPPEIPTPTPTPVITPTPTPVVTPTPTPVVTPTPTPVITPTPTPTPVITPTPTPTATPTATPTPPGETTLKICKYEDDNGNGEKNDGEDTLSWKFKYTVEGESTREVESHWWNFINQGCAKVKVAADKRIVVEEEYKSGWRLTGLFADGGKQSGGSYSYTTEIDKVKIIWFLNTFTPGSNPVSYCQSLTSSVTSGTAPLMVSFTGYGYDSAGSISEYEFNFGDASGGQPQIWNQKEATAFHRYENSGTFTASAKVKDSRGNWLESSTCRITINVFEKPKVLGVTNVPPVLPKAGGNVVLDIVGLTSLLGAGRLLFRRIKIV